MPFPSPGDLPDPGIEPGSPALQADSLPTEQQAPHKELPWLNLKKNDTMPFAAPRMDLKIVILSEVSLKEKEKYDISYMWNLKRNDTNELIYKSDTDS